MAKFNEKTFLNFTAEDFDVSEVMEDYREAIRQESCAIGDRFFFYQRGFFDKRVVSMAHVLWMFPGREAQKGMLGAVHQDLGKLTMYDKEGNRMEFLFDTPVQVEHLYAMLQSTFAEEFQIIAGVSAPLQRALEEGGVEGFHAYIQAQRNKNPQM